MFSHKLTNYCFKGWEKIYSIPLLKIVVVLSFLWAKWIFRSGQPVTCSYDDLEFLYRWFPSIVVNVVLLERLCVSNWDFPENNCIGIRITYDRWNVNLHTLRLLEHFNRWMGSWLLENGTLHICRRVFILIFFPCRYQGKHKGRKQRWYFTLNTPAPYLCDIRVDNSCVEWIGL